MHINLNCILTEKALRYAMCDICLNTIQITFLHTITEEKSKPVLIFQFICY